jgi:List-Bact-rpt repeat protein
MSTESSAQAPARSDRPSLPRHLRPALVVATAVVMVLGFLPALALGTATPGSMHASPAPLSAPLAAPAAATLPTTTSPNVVPAPSNIHLGHFVLPGPHPASWGPSGLPPGSEILQTAAAAAPHPSGYSGTPTSSNWDNRFCAGLWPGFDNVWGTNPQGAYASGCYGHDEPGVQFYSNLPGSGGNVTWNITLPTDRSSTFNQSNLYSAMWFGMAMNDPYGWLNMCFLELQFYPDQTWYNPGPLYPSATVNGAWVGAAVAWQIEASTGFEDPCFYEPLYLNGVPGPAYLNMTQGDHVKVTMTGYATSPTGEQISIKDLTNGQASSVVMFNSAQNYPVDPAYSANNYPAAFQWTPGGEYPVAFAFETGHAGNPDWPANNSYGGCSGGPQSTPQDPGAPCPSYDPGSWANDSLTPWHIDMPTFFNAHTTQSAEPQVAFTQPEGGMNLVDQTSNGVCSGIEGTAWCSYPWYSYYCSEHTFEFGATDYPGVTTDFGKWTQFNRVSQSNAAGIGFFPPINFSVPTCGAPSYTLTVGSSGTPGGWAYFLHSAYTAPTAVAGLGAGSYSLNAVPPAGAYFSGWTATGGASVAQPNSPWTSVTLTGTGTVTAAFSTTAPTKTAVTFNSAPYGFVGVLPSRLFTTGTPIATVFPGGSASLAPGIYTIQAYPKPGFNFTDWTWNNGVIVAASHFPTTWLTVTGASSTATVVAHYAPTTLTATVGVYVIGSGSWKIAGHTIANVGPGFNFGSFQVPAGSYKTVITPAAGTISTGILYGTSVVMTDFRLVNHITFENGSDLLEVIFTPGAAVTFDDHPATGGSIALFGAVGTMGNDTTLDLGLGVNEVTAVPATGFGFTKWTTSNAADVQIFTPTRDVTLINVSGGPATVTAWFTSYHTLHSVTFKASPGTVGAVQFNLGAPSFGTTVNPSVAPGEYLVTAYTTAGWAFADWTATSKIAFVTSSFGQSAIIDVTGAGTLTANFVRAVVLVTVVIDTPEGHTAAIQTITLGGHLLHSGDSITLTAGAYWVQLGSNDDGLYTWEGTPGIGVASPHATGSTVHILASGTVYAIIVNTDSGHEGPH